MMSSSGLDSSLKRSSSCACDYCTCGPNCQCTETLCRCEASSLLNSLNKGNKTFKTKRSSNKQDEPSKKVSFQDNEDSPKSNGETKTTLEIGIQGMTCTMCSKAVTAALNEMEAVFSANVSVATNSATVVFDSSKATPQELCNAIDAVGYEAFLDEEDPSAASSARVVEFSVRGMTCSMCSQAIQRALEGVAGVEDVNVSLSTNIARAKFDLETTNVEALRDTIESIGYEVSGETQIEDDGFEISEDRLERMLAQQGKEVQARKNAFLWSLAGSCPILMLTMVLPHLPKKAGLEGFLNREIHFQGQKFVVEALILWVLCTPIQFGSGWSFFKMSYLNLKQGIMGMDVLVAVGTSASYVYAVWATFSGSMEYHFFETSAVLISFVLLGKWLQRYAIRQTSQALTQLLALQPKTAVKIFPPASVGSDRDWSPLTDSFEEDTVPATSIHKGDLVKIIRSASIPADGVVKFGELTVDESMMTGESLPVLKTKGSIVLGGTICVEASQSSGAAFIEVTGVGKDTALSAITKLVHDAQSKEVPIQSLADRIAGIFVPAVITISVLTYMIWYGAIQSGMVPSSYLPEGESPSTFSLLFGIACVVISCPCALGLATPTAVMVGTGVAASKGILMKGGETLEVASKVDAVVFDKTGTLTKGKPTVTDFTILASESDLWGVILKDAKSARNGSREHLLWLLGSLERNSEHPLASAVVAYAERHLDKSFSFVQPTDFSAMTGRGASGVIDGNTKVAVGNRAFCSLDGIGIDRQAEDTMQRMERQGKTAILVAVNGHICAVMGIADQLKSDAASALLYLREKMNVDVWMVTGDNRRTARAIAQQLKFPMDRVIAEALPAAKVQKVIDLQSQGFKVAFVGDGTNDAPALAQSDLGLSIGTGTEIAAEAADMVLVKGNLADVCTAFDLSQVIFRRIKLNLLWSLLYNSLGIPVAAGVFYPIIRTRLPPAVAALAMVMSSISVVSSSLALKLYQPPLVQTGATPSSSRSPRSRSSSEELQQPLLQDDSEQEVVHDPNDAEEGRAVIVSI